MADLIASCHTIDTIPSSRDGASLAVEGLSPTLSIWETRTWAERSRLTGRIAYRLAYTPDGKTLAAGLSDGTVALQDVDTGRVRAVLQGHTRRVGALAATPDGKRLAAGGDEGQIAMWQPTTGRRSGTFYHGNHAGEVTALAFSKDGKMLAAGGSQVVQFWDVEAAMRKTSL